MKEAHADSVMILGEGFHKDEAIDFASQTMIKRVAEIVPAVLKERLRAPPEEVYSVHRLEAHMVYLQFSLALY